MARGFLQIDENGVAVAAIVVSEQDAADGNGPEFCHGIHGGTWVEAESEGKMRGGIGFIYLEDEQALVHPKPFESWTLDREKLTWMPPTPRPEHVEGKIHSWNEETGEWVQGEDIIYGHNI